MKTTALITFSESAYDKVFVFLALRTIQRYQQHSDKIGGHITAKVSLFLSSVPY